MVLRIIIYCLLALSLCPCAAMAQDDVRKINLRGQELLDRGQYRQASEVFWQAIAIGAQSGDPTLDYAQSLSGYAEAIYTKDLRLADSLYCTSLAIIDKTAGKGSDYARTLQSLAEIRMVLQQYDGVEEMLTQVLQITAKHFGTKSMQYADALSMQGWYYACRANFSQSEKASDKALQIARNIDPNSYEYGKIVHRSIVLYYSKQDFATTENHCRQAIAIYEKSRAPFDRKLVEAKANLAMLYMRITKVKQGEQMILHMLPMVEQEYGKDDYIYSIIHMTLGSAYATYGWEDRAIAVLEQAIVMNKRLVGERHESYSNALNNLAALYMRTDKFEQAETLLKRSLEIRKEIYGESSSQYIQELNNLAVLYQNTGYYLRAIEMLTEAAERSEALLGVSSKNFILALYNIALCCEKIKMYEDAIEFTDIIDNIITEFNLADRSEFIEICAGNLLVAIRSGRSEPAVEQKLKRMAANLLSLYGETNISYQGMINALSIYYIEKDDYKLGLQYAVKYSELAEKYRGKESAPYLWALCNKSAAYCALSRWAEAESTLMESLDIARKLAQKNFSFMSAGHREEYWSLIRRSLSFIEDLVLYAADGDAPRMTELLYNSSIFARALLLNYWVNTQRSIIESDDPQMISMWRELKKLRAQSDKDPQSVEHLENQLALNSKAYRNQLDDFSATWQQVRDNLSQEEAAVEIVTIAVNRDNPTLHYAGLLLRRGGRSPRMVMLCDAKELKDTLSRSPYAGEALYSMLFKQLEEHLDGVSRVYIAAGELAGSVSFAGMKGEDGYLLDKYSIRTLLSTKDIARVKQFEQPLPGAGSIALFGGADFGLSPTELAESGSPDASAALSERLDLSRGQGFDYLPGSKREVMQIGDLLSANGWKATVYTDEQAVESKFKALSSNPVDVIHISTHGYYFPLKDTEQPTDGNMFKTSDDPLIRSGLLFSGANSVWSKSAGVGSDADGVLTGSEISLMDLNNTRLVVLSACNTALGDVDFREGIYGLQRAFRMAGVEAMLVSLWEIPDNETSIFMKTFYENMVGGVSLHSAFEATMHQMKGEYSANPRAWAGFVLIE